MSDREPVIRVVDDLGHDLPASTARFAQAMLTWLELEAVMGTSTPGLDEMRELLRVQVDADE